jgi:hypothetical protein
MKVYLSATPLLLALQFAGCTSSVEETEDSVRIEVEIPKVETGEQPPDLDPGTDDDVDVDTPIPGDS